MNPLNLELQNLQHLMIEMMEMVKAQMNLSKEAIFNFDLGIAESVIRAENRIDALELTIENECEKAIALYQPVATDLRMILSIFKSVSELERIGDHARYFCKNLNDRSGGFDAQLLELLEFEPTFVDINQMFDFLIIAINQQDTASARKVFKTDKIIHKRYRKAVERLNQEISGSGSSSNDYLLLYSFLTRLERTSNLLTNIAEEIIFHVEAKVIKHNKEAIKQIIKSSDDTTETAKD